MDAVNELEPEPIPDAAIAHEDAVSAELSAWAVQRGFALNFRSSHLLSRNWIQLSLLGDPPRAGLEQFLHTLKVVHGHASTTKVFTPQVLRQA